MTKICTVKDCEIELELELSIIIEICRWCRKEFEPTWSDDEWLDDWLRPFGDDSDSANQMEWVEE
jgi:hypothetical protein